MPEIGWFSSTREEDAGRGVLRPKALVSPTWHYACESPAAAKCEGREALREPSVGPPGASR